MGTQWIRTSFRNDLILTPVFQEERRKFIIFPPRTLVDFMYKELIKLNVKLLEIGIGPSGIYITQKMQKRETPIPAHTKFATYR